MNTNAKSKGSGLSVIAGCLLPSLALFRKNDPLRMAGATAFFTTFALPPIVFILAQAFGLLLTPGVVGRGLIENLSDNLGYEGAEQVRTVIRSIRGFSNSWYVIVLGFIFLLFVATTLFSVIKNSLNQIWEIAVKEKPGIRFTIFTRLRSFAAIMLAGILFLAGMLFKSIESMGGGYLEKLVGGGSIYFRLVFGELSGVIIVAAWFIVLFRFLADGRPTWNAALTGGLLTGLLYTAGSVVLRAMLTDSNIGKLYGASGSFVLVLLFVFYTSLIMYYGACFIKVYSGEKGWVLGHDEFVRNEKAPGKDSTL